MSCNAETELTGLCTGLSLEAEIRVVLWVGPSLAAEPRVVTVCMLNQAKDVLFDMMQDLSCTSTFVDARGKPNKHKL